MAGKGSHLNGATIIVVEDDDATREFLADNLKADSYQVVAAASGRQALNLLEMKECDLLLLDVMLPDASGFELCRRVREADGLAQRIDPQIPVIMLTGRSSETDRVRGFARGADDYVVKPFHYQELAARVEAVLRRSRGRSKEGVLHVGELRVDPVAREVTVDGRKVELSAKEFALLRTLAAEPTRVFTKEELLRDVWGFKLMGSTRTLDSHASRLRRKARSVRPPLGGQRLGRRLSADGQGLMRPRVRRFRVAEALHELRGALAAVELGLSAIEAGSSVNRDTAQLDAVRTQSERALAAIEDLDEILVHRQRARPRRRSTPVDVGQIVRRRADAWDRLAYALGGGVELRWNAGPALVEADPKRLCQALDNLIANGLEHGDGLVTLEGNLGDGFVRITVSDRGPGIGRPLDELPRASWQARHGHGLAVVQRAVESHRGRLRAIPGVNGTTVEIELPLWIPADRRTDSADATSNRSSVAVRAS